MSSALSERSINEILDEARDALQKVDFVIRSGLPERDLEADGETWIKRHVRLAEGAVRTSRTVELPRTAERAARSAVVEVRAHVRAQAAAPQVAARRSDNECGRGPRDLPSR